MFRRNIRAPSKVDALFNQFVQELLADSMDKASILVQIGVIRSDIHAAIDRLDEIEASLGDMK